jgi:methylenetetrahydrofolate reductase (NADPH)
MSDVFISYLSGKIKKFPFSEGPIAAETSDISESLRELNSNKILTINSQPKVNGVKSSDTKFGWGPDNGYIYQKAYFEFFIHPQLIQPLVEFLHGYEDITFQAINAAGEKY